MVLQRRVSKLAPADEMGPEGSPVSLACTAETHAGLSNVAEVSLAGPCSVLRLPPGQVDDFMTVPRSRPG